MFLSFHSDMYTYKTSPALNLSQLLKMFCTFLLRYSLLASLPINKASKGEKKIGSSSLFLQCLEERSCTLHITIRFQCLHLHHLFLWCVIRSISKETINLPRKPFLNDSLKSAATVSLLYCSSLLFFQMILQMLFLASFNEITYFISMFGL